MMLKNKFYLNLPRQDQIIHWLGMDPKLDTFYRQAVP